MRTHFDWTTSVVRGARLTIAFVVGTHQGYVGSECLRCGAGMKTEVTEKRKNQWHYW